MLGFVIGDSDMVVGFRLVGVEGTEVTSAEEARQALVQALARNDVAVVIVSEEYSKQLRGEIDKIRAERVTPLILEVPGSMGAESGIHMSELISKTLGIRI